MNWRVAYKRIVDIVGLAAGSFLAAITTEYLFVKLNLNIPTPGIFVANRRNRGIEFGENVVVAVGIDTLLYFLLISILVARFKKTPKETR